MADLAMLLPEDNNERVCAMQLDISNAFNEMPRGKVAEAVLEHAPTLMRWFRLFYGETSDLRMFDGEIVGQSATGVRQGGGSHGDAVLRRRLPGGICINTHQVFGGAVAGGGREQIPDRGGGEGGGG